MSQRERVALKIELKYWTDMLRQLPRGIMEREECGKIIEGYLTRARRYGDIYDYYSEIYRRYK